MTAVHRRMLVALCAALALVFATGANAAIVTSHDDQGRQITFDVRAPNVDTEWYASILRASAHGNEISDVTIRIVPESQIPGLCGGEDASACYTGRSGPPTIMIAAGKSKILEDTLLHEYGHHLDTYWRVSGVPELNGTPVWWAARGMAALLAQHQVAFDYSLGWSHGIGEIFAEDYSYIHTGDRYAIRWLSPPDAALKAALFAELGTPTEPLPFAPEVPSVLNRRGTLVPRDRFSIPFSLLGPRPPRHPRSDDLEAEAEGHPRPGPARLRRARRREPQLRARAGRRGRSTSTTSARPTATSAWSATRAFL